ncbi:MAG: sulfite exporter TauE/SafE family protein [Verrucomicrobiaceae bacterium]|nr:MAG: sulfite exporter TauE/SafE family protein [Verrucomicrobiaceae bacterium]
MARVALLAIGNPNPFIRNLQILRGGGRRPPPIASHPVMFSLTDIHASATALITTASGWDWPRLTPGQWTLALLAGLCCGISKAGLSGVGMLTVLLMAEVVPGKASSGVVLPLLIFADVMAALMFRQEILWRHIRALSAPVLTGIVLGWLIMLRLPDAAFRPVIGAMVLLMLAVHLVRARVPRLAEHLPHSRAFTRGTGLFTGVATMIANAAGPVATIYLLIQKLPKKEFVATMAWLFLLVNLSKVPFSLHLGLISGGSLTLNAVLVPTVLAGLALGRAAVRRMPQGPFQAVVLILAALSALRLLLVR